MFDILGHVIARIRPFIDIECNILDAFLAQDFILIYSVVLNSNIIKWEKLMESKIGIYMEVAVVVVGFYSFLNGNIKISK